MAECKIAVLGCKTGSLTTQFLRQLSDEDYNDPRIEDAYRKQIVIDGMPVELNILDTAGTEICTSMRDIYIKNSHGYVLVYSITNMSSFRELQHLRVQIMRVQKDLDEDTLPMVLVGNKCHKEDKRVVSRYQGEKLAMEWGCSFFEASAKTRHNVDKIFLDIYSSPNSE